MISFVVLRERRCKSSSYIAAISEVHDECESI